MNKNLSSVWDSFRTVKMIVNTFLLHLHWLKRTLMEHFAVLNVFKVIKISLYYRLNVTETVQAALCVTIFTSAEYIRAVIKWYFDYFESLPLTNSFMSTTKCSINAFHSIWIWFRPSYAISHWQYNIYSFQMKNFYHEIYRSPR